MNAYAYLAAEAGYKVNSLRIVALCRDWRMSDAEKYKDEGYPEFRVAVLPQRLWEPRQDLRLATRKASRCTARHVNSRSSCRTARPRSGGRSRAAGR